MRDDTADRLAIMDKIYRYCRSVDRLDVPLGHSVFHEDSYADFSLCKGPGRGWIDHVCQEHLNFLHHSHQVTNIVLEIDGDCAGSESRPRPKASGEATHRRIPRMFKGSRHQGRPWQGAQEIHVRMQARRQRRRCEAEVLKPKS